MNNEKIGYRDILGQKEYVKLIIANLISRFGDSIDALAFTWIVYQVTGSASWSAIIFACNQLPSILVLPFAGALVEGMNKKKIMVGADFIRGTIVALLAILIVTNHVNAWVLLGFTIIISTVEAFCIPATTAVIPQIIDLKYYEYASSLNQTLSMIMQLAGMGIAGTIISLWGANIAITIDAITFFSSALILGMLHIKENNSKREKKFETDYFRNLRDGFIYLKKEPIIRNFCIMAVIINALIVPINALQSPMITELLGQDAEFLSVFGIAITVGMGIGSIIFPKIAERISTQNLICIAGIGVGLGIYIMTLGQYTQDRFIIICAITILSSFLVGIGSSIMSSAVSVRFMKTVDREYLARSASIFNACASVASPAMSFLVGIAAKIFSIGQIFVFFAVLCVILFVWIKVNKIRFA